MMRGDIKSTEWLATYLVVDPKFFGPNRFKTTVATGFGLETIKFVSVEQFDLQSKVRPEEKADDRSRRASPLNSTFPRGRGQYLSTERYPWTRLSIRSSVSHTCPLARPSALGVPAKPSSCRHLHRIPAPGSTTSSNANSILRPSRKALPFVTLCPVTLRSFSEAYRICWRSTQPRVRHPNFRHPPS